MPKIYLDNHTATKPFPMSVEAMLPFFRNNWGSLTSPHQMGLELIPALNKYTDSILYAFGAASDDRFCFFHSGAEAIEHLYLSHYFETVRNTGKNHVLTTSIEGASVFTSLKRLEDLGCHGKILSVDEQGQLTKKTLEEAINPRTSLLSISWANGLTGVIHPIADLAEVCREKGVLLHVDASYVTCKLYFRFEDYPIDFLTFDGSLIHAPKGTAGLVTKAKTLLSSVPEVSVGGVAAIARALEDNSQLFDYICLETARLRDKLERGIQDAISDAEVFFQKVERLPNCTSIAFPGVSAEALLFMLHRKGVYATLGGGHAQKLSHVLMAAGIDEQMAACALSFSLSFETQEEEIDRAVAIITECVQKLKGLSCKILEGAS